MIRGKRFGLLFPQKEGEMARATAGSRDVLGRKAQAGGLDPVWLVDHFAYEPYVDEAVWGHSRQHRRQEPA